MRAIGRFFPAFSIYVLGAGLIFTGPVFMGLVFMGLPFTGEARAGAWIEQIEGDAADVIVRRGGDMQAPSELMRLKPGDEVEVLADGVVVSILLGGGAMKKIGKAQSPFVLPGGEESSFLGNLMREARGLLDSGGDKTQAVAMMTRGESKQVRLLAVGADENFVLRGADRLALAWSGGEGPFKLQLQDMDSEKKVASGSGGADRRAMLGVRTLPAGGYRLTLKDGAKRPSGSEVEITMVEADDLPDAARRLVSLKLDKRVEARLLISLLYKLPEWRFYAHDLALRHGLDKERAVILAQR